VGHNLILTFFISRQKPARNRGVGDREQDRAHLRRGRRLRRRRSGSTIPSNRATISFSLSRFPAKSPPEIARGAFAGVVQVLSHRKCLCRYLTESVYTLYLTESVYERRLRRRASGFISQKVFTRSFCKSQILPKLVNLSSMLMIMKDKLTDLCGN